MAFHINPDTGNPGKCSAQDGNCPFGSSDEHYSTPEAARAAYEEGQPSLFGTSEDPTKMETRIGGALPHSDLVANTSALEEVEWAQSEVERLQEELAIVQEQLMFADPEAVGSLEDQQYRLSIDLQVMERHLDEASKELLSPAAPHNLDPLTISSTVDRALRNSEIGGLSVWTEDDGMDTIVLQTPSSSHAHVAKAALAERGYIVSHIEGGSSIRVGHSSTNTVKSSKDFNWHGPTRSFTMEASEFGSNPSKPFFLTSQKTGEAVLMVPVSEDRDSSNDITSWTFVPEDPFQNWTLTLFND